MKNCDLKQIPGAGGWVVRYCAVGDGVNQQLADDSAAAAAVTQSARGGGGDVAASAISGENDSRVGVCFAGDVMCDGDAVGMRCREHVLGGAAVVDAADAQVCGAG